jgi:hypothetical protein
VLLLDPHVSQKQRSARALLEDIVSAYFERLAWKHLAGAKNDTFKAKDAVYRRLRACAE